MDFVAALFWIFIFFLFYPYLIYPILLIMVFATRRLPPSTSASSGLPPLSIVIPAYNEEEIIAQKIQNALNIDYPEELIQIIVVSDASTDRTNELVAGFKDKGVYLIVNKQRRGKTYGLNRACEIANGEILIFTDANAMFDTQALRIMVLNFADPKVGLVTGSTNYYARNEDGSMILLMGLYTRFERWIKSLESRVMSCVGADGAVFGLRKALYRPLAEGDINDFVTPLDVVRQGYRVIFDPRVFCVEEHSTDESGEFWRQVRIANRTIRALITHRDLLNPFRYGFFAWMLWSHKALRFLFPWFALLLLGANVILAFSMWHIYKASAVCFIILLITIVLFRKSEHALFSLLRSFTSMNQAFLVAWFKVFKKQTIVVWEKDQDGQA